MKHVSYYTEGVCARYLEFDLDENNKIHNLKFMGGCNGNLKAISRLVENKDATEIAEVLSGNTCGFKQTSCADQFSKAIMQALENN